MKDKRIKVIVIGCGNRARAYCQVAEEIGDPYEIVAAVDFKDEALLYMQERFNVPKDMCFNDYRDAVKLGKIAHCVINTTMDQFHVETSIPFLELGYDLLLEKPITNNKEDLLKVANLAKENNCKLFICQVLRYTPFYKQAKQLIDDGRIGEVVHIEATEYPGVLLTDHSFIRGQWRNSNESGSSFLLTKACHDVDLICWLNNSTKPAYVSSFGNRNFINKTKAPKGATETCFDGCPHVDTCMYSVGYNSVHIKTIWGTLPPGGAEEEIQKLKNDRTKSICAYKSDANIVDHQTVIIEFENGSTSSLTVLASGIPEVRDLYVKGTEGVIDGKLQENKFVLRKHDVQTGWENVEVFDFNNLGPLGGHSGGDSGLISDFNAFLRDEGMSISSSPIEDTLSSYLCIYGADEAMEKRMVVKL